VPSSAGKDTEKEAQEDTTCKLANFRVDFHFGGHFLLAS